MKFKRGEIIAFGSSKKGTMMMLENERLSCYGERTADVYCISPKSIIKDIRLDWCRHLSKRTK